MNRLAVAAGVLALATEKARWFIEIGAGKEGCRSALPTRLLVTALAVGALQGPAWAFHDGGVASCGGCHVVHNSVDGRPIDPGPGNNYQLIGENPTDVCLMCHAEGPGGVLGLDPLAPPPELGAGNFVFLLEDNINDGPDGRIEVVSGHAAGHNLVAPSRGLIADPRYVTSPGGTFPAGAMGCTSCHDPHGREGFRMLNGAGNVQGRTGTFFFEAPEAIGLDLRSEGERRNRHTAYRSGMTNWCRNCHGRYHEDESTQFAHPVDRSLGSEVEERYNRYDGDDNSSGGSRATAYLPEVTFEDGTSEVESTTGPTAVSRITCLTCHRAHASSAPSAGRWDFNVSLLIDDGIESGSWPLPSPYGHPDQGSLCFKCHESLQFRDPGISDPFNLGLSNP